MVGCVLNQLKPSGFSILSCGKGLGLRPWTFFTAKNGELLGLYPIRNQFGGNVWHWWDILHVQFSLTIHLFLLIYSIIYIIG